MCYPKRADRYVTGDCRGGSPLMLKQKYHWAVPDSTCDAPYEQFDKTKILSFLKGKNLFVIGDSVSEQFYATLMSSLLSSEKCEVCTHFCHGDDVMEVRGVDNELLMKTISIRNDAFWYDHWRDDTNMGYTHYQHHQQIRRQLTDLDFYTPLVKNDISFVIFNTGAHYRPNDKLLEAINCSLTFLFENHPNLSVVFRSTTAGHSEWKDMLLSEPLTQLPKVHESWHWSKFQDQNKLVETFLTTHFPQVLQLDVYAMTLLRADMHCDGLHYCLPGPINEWVIYLYNSLRLVYSFHA